MLGAISNLERQGRINLIILHPVSFGRRRPGSYQGITHQAALAIIAARVSLFLALPVMFHGPAERECVTAFARVSRSSDAGEGAEGKDSRVANAILEKSNTKY